MHYLDVLHIGLLNEAQYSTNYLKNTIQYINYNYDKPKVQTLNIQKWRNNVKLSMTTKFLPFVLATTLLGLIGCSSEEESAISSVSEEAVNTSPVEATMESAEETMNEVKETVMEDVNKTAEETKEVAMQKVDDTKEAATEQVQETVDNANEAADEKVNDVMKGLTDKLGH